MLPKSLPGVQGSLFLVTHSVPHTKDSAATGPGKGGQGEDPSPPEDLPTQEQGHLAVACYQLIVNAGQVINRPTLCLSRSGILCSGGKAHMKTLSNMSGPPTSFSRQEKLGYKSQPVQDLVEA